MKASAKIPSGTVIIQYRTGKFQDSHPYVS